MLHLNAWVVKNSGLLLFPASIISCWHCNFKPHVSCCFPFSIHPSCAGRIMYRSSLIARSRMWQSLKLSGMSWSKSTRRRRWSSRKSTWRRSWSWRRSSTQPWRAWWRSISQMPLRPPARKGASAATLGPQVVDVAKTWCPCGGSARDTETWPASRYVVAVVVSLSRSVCGSSIWTQRFTCDGKWVKLQLECYV